MDHTVSAIKVQQRNPQRVSIYLDGEFAFGMARIVAAWLSVGRVLTDAEIADLRGRDTLESAHLQSLRLLNFRPRSSTEIRHKLTEKGFEPDVIDLTLQRLLENGLLDDARFAKNWVESRSMSHPRGRRVLALELKQKGIAEEVIQTTLEKTNDEEDLAYQSGQKQARKLVGLEKMEFRNRLGAYLARRGFSYDVAAPVVQRLWSELQSEQNPPAQGTGNDKA